LFVDQIGTVDCGMGSRAARRSVVGREGESGGRRLLLVKWKSGGDKRNGVVDNGKSLLGMGAVYRCKGSRGGGKDTKRLMGRNAASGGSMRSMRGVVVRSGEDL